MQDSHPPRIIYDPSTEETNQTNWKKQKNIEDDSNKIVEKIGYRMSC
jgi:hypothetical protein